MRRRFQWLLLALLGWVVLRTAITDEYLRYVQPFMRPVLIVTGAVVLLLGLTDMLRTLHGRDRRLSDDHDGAHEHGHAPRTAWLLLLPVICVSVVAPPALGSFSAERAVNVPLVDDRTTEEVNLGYPPLPPAPVVPLTLTDFSMRALWDTAATLEGRSLRLTGFVTPRNEGGWYVTRMSIECCAADAGAIRVTVLGQPSPPVDHWVEVEGTWVPNGPPLGSGSAQEWQEPEPAQLNAARVRAIEAPREPYE